MTNRSMGDKEDNQKATKNGCSMSVVLFVLNIVILHNTTTSGFQSVMPHGDKYHDFHVAMMIAASVMMGMFMVLLWLGCIHVCSDGGRCTIAVATWTSLTLLGIVAVLIMQYTRMGKIWHVDPQHTLFWYNSYWTEGITNFTNVMNVTNVTMQHMTNSSVNLRGSGIVPVEDLPHWPYVMSDVVVRIYGFLLMSVCVIVAILGCCGGSAWACTRGSKSTSTPRPVVVDRVQCDQLTPRNSVQVSLTTIT